MAPPQGETRVSKVSFAFTKTSKNIGKWLRWRSIQAQTIAHGKGPNSASNSSSGRQNTPPLIATHIHAENQLPASMSANERRVDLPLQPPQPKHFVNLPPPPPPQQSTFSPLIRAATPGVQEHHEIEKQHDNLMAARENLQRYRFQMMTERRKIRETREKTGVQEGSLIHQLRTFLHKQDIPLPPSIQQTFEEIDALRSQLGHLEDQYDDSEKDYTMKEIEHSQKEMHFIDKLGNDHSCRPAASTFAQIRGNLDTMDKAPFTSTCDWEFKKQSKETQDVSSREKGLQLAIQTKLHQDAKRVDELQGIDLAIFANKENVADWLINTLLQSPIPLEGWDQDSEMEQVPEGWYWLGTIGAQFRDEGLEDSYGRSNEHDSASSSNGTIPYGEPVLVLHTKGLRSS